MKSEARFNREELERYRLMLTEMRAQILNKLRYREGFGCSLDSEKAFFLEVPPETRRSCRKASKGQSVFLESLDALIQQASLKELRHALSLQLYEACSDIVAIAREFQTSEQEIEKVLKSALIRWERVHPQFNDERISIWREKPQS